ncbi:MAG: helix-turn-helix domain-containing protein [Candidatus Diapherotrites archaeon]
MALEIFDFLGLSKREQEIYLVLLKKGASRGADIAKKLSISRPHIYDSLNSLIDAGLVSYITKAGSRYYSAASPEKIMDLLRAKKDDLLEKEKKLQEFLPSLLSMQEKTKPNINVEIFEGKEGTRTVFNDANRQTLETDKEMVLFGAASGIFRKLDPIFHKKHYNERERYGIRARYIFNEGADVVKHPLIKMRILPKEFKTPAVTWIFGNKVSIWSLSEGHWIAAVIETPSLADSYRDYFDFLWKIAKPGR